MPNKEKTFEEKMNKLEDIVHKIDNSEASLDESLKLYFEGKGTSRQDLYCASGEGAALFPEKGGIEFEKSGQRKIPVSASLRRMADT